jgi:hypothetical protein
MAERRRRKASSSSTMRASARQAELEAEAADDRAEEAVERADLQAVEVVGQRGEQVEDELAREVAALEPTRELLALVVGVGRLGEGAEDAVADLAGGRAREGAGEDRVGRGAAAEDLQVAVGELVGLARAGRGEDADVLQRGGRCARAACPEGQPAGRPRRPRPRAAARARRCAGRAPGIRPISSSRVTPGGVEEGRWSRSGHGACVEVGVGELARAVVGGGSLGEDAQAGSRRDVGGATGVLSRGTGSRGRRRTWSSCRLRRAGGGGRVGVLSRGTGCSRGQVGGGVVDELSRGTGSAASGAWRAVGTGCGRVDVRRCGGASARARCGRPRCCGRTRSRRR